MKPNKPNLIKEHFNSFSETDQLEIRETTERLYDMILNKLESLYFTEEQREKYLFTNDPHLLSRVLASYAIDLIKDK